VLVLAVAAAAAVAAGAAGGGTVSTIATVPVNGTTTGGGVFVGTMDVSSFAVQGGQLVAIGTVSGAVTDAAGNTIQIVDAEPLAAPIQQAQQVGDCTLVSFSIGPIDLNVLGIVLVHVEPIAVEVGLGGLVGSLLCGLLGGGGVTPPPLPAAA
jgi:hypothetical protein